MAGAAKLVAEEVRQLRARQGAPAAAMMNARGDGGGAAGGRATTGACGGLRAKRRQQVARGEQSSCGGGAGKRRRRGAAQLGILSEEDDEDGEADEPQSPPSPSPSDHVDDWFNAEYSEEEVASVIDDILPVHDPARMGLAAGEKREMVRRIVHRRTSSAAIKPWKGPFLR